MRSFNYTSYRDKQWDTEVLGLVALIHEYKGKADAYLQNKRAFIDKLVKSAAIGNTEASNKIEGIVTSEARLYRLCDAKALPRNEDERELLNYYTVLRSIGERYNELPVCPETILRLHRALFAHTKKDGGRYKKSQNFITDPITQDVRFMPVTPYETSEAVERLCVAYNDAVASSAADPLLLIPVFVNDFLCIHPFDCGNGRMSRLLTFLLLMQNSYVSVKYFCADCNIERSQDKYYKALSQSDKDWHVSKNDPTPFIRYTLGVLCQAYGDFVRSIDFSDEKLLSSEHISRAVVATNGKFTKNDIMRLVPSVGKASVENALKTMTDKGAIERYGKGRATFYVRTEKKITPRFLNPDRE